MVEVLLSLVVSLSDAEALKITQVVEQEALMYGLDPMLVYAVIKTESRFNKRAIGKSHQERGLMQLRPEYFGEVPLDIKQNIKAGVKYLAEVKRLCHNRYGTAWVVCYNTGPNSKLKHPKLFPYYKKVMENYTKLHNKQMSLNGYAAL